mmetsp:Transcript_37181/g.61150  ORF Transcript_37181/g.61150 Transcript_37181/m.61150 type:complete len:246 (+) Transcript_37181:130-867(+)
MCVCAAVLVYVFLPFIIVLELRQMNVQWIIDRFCVIKIDTLKIQRNFLDRFFQIIARVVELNANITEIIHLVLHRRLQLWLERIHFIAGEQRVALHTVDNLTKQNLVRRRRIGRKLKRQILERRAFNTIPRRIHQEQHQLQSRHLGRKTCHIIEVRQVLDLVQHVALLARNLQIALKNASHKTWRRIKSTQIERVRHVHLVANHALNALEQRRKRGHQIFLVLIVVGLECHHLVQHVVVRLFKFG